MCLAFFAGVYCHCSRHTKQLPVSGLIESQLEHLCCRWLNPAVFVLMAAYDTLRHETYAGAPDLHPIAGAEQPDSRTQQFKQWVSSMWQFQKR